MKIPVIKLNTAALARNATAWLKKNRETLPPVGERRLVRWEQVFGNVRFWLDENERVCWDLTLEPDFEAARDAITTVLADVVKA